MQVTTLNQKLVDESMPVSERPVAAKQPEQPCDVGEFMAKTQIPKLNPRSPSISLGVLDAISYGAKITVQQKDGTSITYNKDSDWTCSIKEDDSARYNSEIDNPESQEIVLRGIINTVIRNENSFSPETVISYVKVSQSHMLEKDGG